MSAKCIKYYPIAKVELKLIERTLTENRIDYDKQFFEVIRNRRSNEWIPVS